MKVLTNEEIYRETLFTHNQDDIKKEKEERVLKLMQLAREAGKQEGMCPEHNIEPHYCEKCYSEKLKLAKKEAEQRVAREIFKTIDKFDDVENDCEYCVEGMQNEEGKLECIQLTRLKKKYEVK
jgi:hypothetical protein